MADTSKDYIAYRVSKSDEIFADAKLLAENNRWNSCVNRLYYSAYYLVSALLYKRQIKAVTHNGVRTEFFQHFVKTEIASKDLGKLYTNLFGWRQESDYADFIDFEKETVQPLINSVAEFNNAVKLLLESWRLFVPGRGLEPLHLAAYAPQTYLSTNSNTRAEICNM